MSKELLLLSLRLLILVCLLFQAGEMAWGYLDRVSDKSNWRAFANYFEAGVSSDEITKFESEIQLLKKHLAKNQVYGFASDVLEHKWFYAAQYSLVPRVIVQLETPSGKIDIDRKHYKEVIALLVKPGSVKYIENRYQLKLDKRVSENFGIFK